VLIGKQVKHCDNGDGHHGTLNLVEAIAESCDIYFYEHGIRIGPNAIAEEARRFHLDQPTGIELPNESQTSRVGRQGLLIPDPEWKERVTGERWSDGDTANMAIGQGFILVTPLDMACYAASLARGEVSTRPTLLHDPDRPEQHSDPIGLTLPQRAVLLEGMEACTNLKIPGVRIAGKTGTAQIPGQLDVAWFICFAPLEHPEIAVAVALVGDTPGEAFGGGRQAAPVANAILKTYFAKKSRANPVSPATAQKDDQRFSGSLSLNP